MLTACEIREATDRDSAAVAEVFAAAFTPLRTIYRPIDESAERLMPQTNSQRVVASVSGRIVGTVEVDFHRHKLGLVGLAVHPDRQRAGISRAMVEWIGQRFSTREIELATIRETGNVTIFEKMGFEITGERVADWCVSERLEELHEVILTKRFF